MNNKGNILFLILIAVALFATLSFTITQSSRSGDTGLTKDKAKILATQINTFLNNVKNAHDRLKYVEGCSFVNVGNEVYTTKGGGTLLRNFPTDPALYKCAIYKPEGGGLSPYVVPVKNPRNTTNSAYHYGHAADANRTIIDIGSAEADRTYHFANIDKEVCVAYNELVGVTNPNGEPPLESVTSILGDEAPELAGKLTFCYNRDYNPFGYWLHYVLEAK